MTEFEATLLKKRTRNLLENQEIGDSSDVNGGPGVENLEMQPSKHFARKGMNDKGPQYKRKKAKVYYLLKRVCYQVFCVHICVRSVTFVVR